MGFKQQEQRREQRRARTDGDTVQRVAAVRRDTGVHVHRPVVAGTETWTMPVSPLEIRDRRVPMAWALVCPDARLAFHDFTRAVEAARMVELVHGTCDHAHHVQLVPFDSTDAGQAMTYKQWLLVQQDRAPRPRTADRVLIYIGMRVFTDRGWGVVSDGPYPSGAYQINLDAGPIETYHTDRLNAQENR